MDLEAFFEIPFRSGGPPLEILNQFNYDVRQHLELEPGLVRPDHFTIHGCSSLTPVLPSGLAIGVSSVSQQTEEQGSISRSISLGLFALVPGWTAESLPLRHYEDGHWTQITSDHWEWRELGIN